MSIENKAVDVSRWKKALSMFPDLDKALERNALQTNLYAHLLWIVGLMVGMPFTALIAIILSPTLFMVLITVFWLSLLVAISYLIVRSAIAKTTLSLARLPPEKRDSYMEMASTTGRRIGLGWMVGFMIGMPIHILAGIVGLPIMGAGIQFAVGFGQLNMGYQGRTSSREHLGIGAILLATLPVVVWLEMMVNYYGFWFFTALIFISYSYIAVSNWVKISRLGVLDGQ